MVTQIKKRMVNAISVSMRHFHAKPSESLLIPRGRTLNMGEYIENAHKADTLENQVKITIGALYLIISLILLAFFTSGCFKQDAKGAIYGAVKLNGMNDHSGVLIQITGTSISTVSLASGGYVIYDVPAGNYTMVASKDGFRSATVNVSVQSDQPITVQEFTLESISTPPPPPNTPSISGVVILSDTSAAGGVRVQIPGTGCTATTNADGTYILLNVPEGQCVVEAVKSGYQKAAKSVRVDYDQTVSGLRLVLNSGNSEPDLPGAPDDNTPPAPPTPGQVYGHVYLSGSSDQSGSVVELIGADYTLITSTKYSGDYAFSNVPLGTYTLRATKNKKTDSRQITLTEESLSLSIDFDLGNQNSK